MYQLSFVYILPYRIPEYLIHKKSFALREWQPLIPSPECSTPGRGVYIYYHPQTECFIVSQLFSVAKHAGCFNIYIERERERERGTRVVMVIVVGNGHADTSSNPGRD